MKVLRFLFSLYGFVIFLALMFLLFPLVVLASFFGKVRGGNMIYSICTFWAFAAFFFWGMRHRNIYEADDNPGEPYVFIFNHVSYIDIPTLLIAFRKHHIRVLGKAEMAKIPVFGFIYRKAAVLVDRSSPDVRAKSVKELIAFIRHNISVVIAPEGTFNLTHKPLKEFYDGAFRIAVETQTPVKPVIFPDAYDRLHYRSVFSMTPGKSRAVFLPEIPVEGLTTKDIPSLKERAYAIMEEALIRYEANWINGTGE